jgi:hypothetical protein
MSLKDGDRLFRIARINLKLTGWWPAAVSGFLLAAFFVIEKLVINNADPQVSLLTRRAVETVIPLAFALQAAFLLGPDNEPAMELLLSYPKSIQKIFWDRAILVGSMHGFIAMAATVIFTVAWHNENIFLAMVRWLPAGIFLAGLAVFTTQLTRQAVYAMLLVTLYWGASLYGGDGLLSAWSWFWPFHVYLQPETLGAGIYLLNRLSLAGIGIILTMIALGFLKNEDRLMGNR